MPFGDIRKHARKQERHVQRSLTRSRRSRREIVTVVNQLAEKKYFNTGQNQAITTTTTTGIQLTAVPQQTTAATKKVRIGDVINPTSFKWGYIISNADSSDQSARIILVQWHDDSVPVLQDILQDVGVNQNLHSSYAQNLKKRFTVIFDKLHVMSIAANTSQQASKQINKLKKIRYADGGATTGTSQIYFFAFGQSASGVGMEYYSNLRFTDM